MINHLKNRIGLNFITAKKNTNIKIYLSNFLKLNKNSLNIVIFNIIDTFLVIERSVFENNENKGNGSILNSQVFLIFVNFKF